MAASGKSRRCFIAKRNAEFDYGPFPMSSFKCFSGREASLPGIQKGSVRKDVWKIVVFTGISLQLEKGSIYF